MAKLLRGYGLSIALAVFFIVAWLLQAWFSWFEFVDEQEAHRQAVELGAFLNTFLSKTFENWQSEFLQLFMFVVLTSFLIHKGSPESKDSDEQMEQQLKRIEKRLDELAGSDRAGAGKGRR